MNINDEFDKYYSTISKYLKLNFEKNYEGKLYHYTKKDAAIKILKSQELWVSNLTQMNDRSEWQYGLSLLEREIDNNMYNKKTVELLSKFVKRSKEDVRDYYVFSCTKRYDNEFLWKEYAKNNGYALEFYAPEMNIVLQNLSTKEPSFYQQYKYTVEQGKVLYDSNKQKSIIKYLVSCLDEYINYISEEEEKSLYVNCKFLIATIIEICALFKEIKYKEEDEYRFIFFAIDKEKKLILKFNEENSKRGIPINRIFYKSDRGGELLQYNNIPQQELEDS